MLGHRHKLWSLSWRHQPAGDFSSAIGWLALAVMVVCASTYSTFARGIAGHFHPISLIFIAECLSLVFVFLTFGFVPTFQRILRLKRIDVETLILMGLLCSLIAPLLWFRGLEVSTASNAALLSNSEIIVMTLLSTIVLNERMSSTRILAMCIIFAGLCVVLLESLQSGWEYALGNGYIILATSILGGGGVLFRAKLRHIDPEVVMIMRSLTAIGGFFIMSPFVEWSFVQQVRSFPIALIPTLLGFAFLGRFLNIFCFYEALKRLPVAAMSIAINVPVFGALLFAYIYLGENISGYHILSGLLVVGGSIMLELSTPRHHTQRMSEELVTQTA